MRMLHHPADRQELESRLAALRPDSARAWGRMSPAQMLWHVNQFLAWSLGEGAPEYKKSAIPPFIMKFFLIYTPWPKGAPTNPHAKCKDEAKYDFEAERAKCGSLIGRLASKPIDGPWPMDPSFGPVDGTFVSRLQAKHLDHHFRQFGA